MIMKGGEGMDWANVNLEIITVGECMEMYNQRGIVCVLNDGKLVCLQEE